jgi:hypothetical protein
MREHVCRNHRRQKTSNDMPPLDIIFQKVYDVVAGGHIKARLSTAGSMQNRALGNTGHEGGMVGDAPDISGDA